jgi:methyl-accepting chemotaxis protein
MIPKNTGRSRRKLLGYLVRPRQQIIFTMWLLAVFVLFQAILLALFLVRTDAPGSGQLDSREREFLGAALAYLTVLGFTIAVIGVALSHRIFGPMVPLVRHIRNLAAGDFSSRAHLRRGDFLAELANELNTLAENLEAGRKSDEPPGPR